MAQILDYQVNSPTPVTNGAAIPIPLTPAGQGISMVRVTVPTVVNTVELNATVGLQGINGAVSRVLLRVFRDTTVIYYATQLIEGIFEGFELVSFQAIDPNVKTGVHNYTISVENLDAANAAVVVGPINLSAKVIG
jgi:hypothetical protein